MNSHDRGEKLIAYYQGIILFYFSANAFQFLILKPDLKAIDFIMCFFWFFIFLFRGQTFINEIKKDKNIINQLYLVIGVDFSISVIAYFIFSFFFVFKIGIILWLLSVAEPKLDDDHEERK